MEFGISLFTGQQHPEDERPRSTVYEETLELATLAESVGLDSVWVSEHHFVKDGYMSGIFPTLGALASVTSDIQLGTYVALAPLYDAVRLAEDAATVDLLSDGRLILGLSIGYRRAEFEGFGVPLDERVDRLIDTVNVVRSAWNDGPLAYDSEYHPISLEETVTPKPDGEIPVVLGGMVKPAVARAGRLGDGWAAGEVLTLDDVEKRKRHIERIRLEEGLDSDFEYIIGQHGFIGNSREDAWRRMEDAYRYVERTYAEWEDGEPVDELSKDRVEEMKMKAVFGSPDQVADRIVEYRNALGDDIHFLLRCWHPGTDLDLVADCIRRFGKEVVPQFR